MQPIRLRRSAKPKRFGRRLRNERHLVGEVDRDHRAVRDHESRPPLRTPLTRQHRGRLLDPTSRTWHGTDLPFGALGANSPTVVRARGSVRHAGPSRLGTVGVRRLRPLSRRCRGWRQRGRRDQSSGRATARLAPFSSVADSAHGLPTRRASSASTAPRASPLDGGSRFRCSRLRPPRSSVGVARERHSIRRAAQVRPVVRSGPVRSR